MHSVHRYRGGLYCRNGSVEIPDRLFSGSLDYDFTGLRFQYRRVPPATVFQTIANLFEAIDFLAFNSLGTTNGVKAGYKNGKLK